MPTNDQYMPDTEQPDDLLDKTTRYPDQTEEEVPRYPPTRSPIMSWEEIEQGRSGQLDFPAMTSVPTMAERAFLVLAREWQAEVAKTNNECVLSNTADILALSCLLLAVEWGAQFTDVAREQMEANRDLAAKRRQPSWIDEFPWKLCQVSNFIPSPQESATVQELTANLDHHNSSIRCWMIDLGWFTIPWLNPVEATAKLLKNLADTLGGPFMAAGLAKRFFENSDGFFNFARTFTPPNGFEDQYQTRMKYVKEQGILEMQAPFWRKEALCRKKIEQAVLRFQVRKTEKQA